MDEEVNEDKANPARTVEAAVPAADESVGEVVAAVVSTAEPEKQASAAVDVSTTAAEETEIGGS